MFLATLVAVPLAVLIWAPSSRLRAALVVTALVNWTLATAVAYHLFNQPEFFAIIIFYFMLPFVIAPFGGILARALAGGQRSYFLTAGASILGCVAGLFLVDASAGPIISWRECMRVMAAPAVFAASFAVFVAGLARR